MSPDQRHRLALHVRTHESAVGVVVLEERNERSSDRNQLVRRNVHELDIVGLNEGEVPFTTSRDQSSGKLAGAQGFRRNLGDNLVLFFGRREELDLVGHFLAVEITRYGVSMKPYSLTRA